MLRIALLAIMLSTTIAHAGGTLSVQATDYGTRGIYPMVGFSIYQPLVMKFAADSWIGYGKRPIEGGEREWMSGKLGLQANIKQLTFSFGAFANSSAVDDMVSVDTDKVETGGYAKLSYKLW